MPRQIAGRRAPRVVFAILIGCLALAALSQALAARSAQGVASTYFGIYGWSPDRPLERSTARQVGAGIGQVAIDWGQIEFTEAYSDVYGPQNTFDSTYIAPIDARLRAVTEAGLQPILLIVNPPAWALQVPETQGPLKADKVGKYASFVRRIVARYGGAPYNVRHVVLFPEPDHRQVLPAQCAGSFSPIHRGWGDAPSEFASMLQQTYPVVKAANPSVSVIMGALAYDNFGGASRPSFTQAGPCAPFNYTFLDDVLAAGGASYFDVFAFNSYASFALDWEQQAQAGGAYDVAAKANVIRAKFPQLAGKPFFVLESGVWSDDSAFIRVRQADDSIASFGPNADWQAGYPAKLFSRALSAGVGAVIWYGMRDYAGDVQRGLLDQSDQAKKVVTGFRQATLRLTGSDFVGNLTPNATASGKAEGYVFTTITGGRLVVVWAVGDPSARARVTIDMPGGNVRAYDLLGNARSGLAASGSAVTLDLDSSPVYVMSGPLELRTMVPLVPRNVGNP